ncbi:hypothetical protein HQ590_02265 [bacterium]|nr:hypothetical protein [bacterium]
MKYFRKLLREFNSSGVTNNLPQGIVECSPIRKKELKPIARDPSTASTCPGINDTCLVAENILRVPVKRSLKLNKHTDGEDGPSCFGGGRDAFYRVSPPVAAAGRHFIVDTSDSNFRTLLSVRRGTCNALDEITCSSGGRDGLAAESRVMFTADGTNTFFIAVEGLNGAYGKTKVEIYSY